ncbi:hypothetical protein MRB53_023051 [Persea americana]|uniref:Uncharacterized protein n=1 Tax=Persea americana TaxID=3435 RepID=A0ACC2L9K5_PERAE|nr:hypothetical protein MRB53_023051 [Persea americana]
MISEWRVRERGFHREESRERVWEGRKPMSRPRHRKKEERVGGGAVAGRRITGGELRRWIERRDEDSGDRGARPCKLPTIWGFSPLSICLREGRRKNGCHSFALVPRALHMLERFLPCT